MKKKTFHPQPPEEKLLKKSTRDRALDWINQKRGIEVISISEAYAKSGSTSPETQDRSYSVTVWYRESMQQ